MREAMTATGAGDADLKIWGDSVSARVFFSCRCRAHLCVRVCVCTRRSSARAHYQR